MPTPTPQQPSTPCQPPLPPTALHSINLDVHSAPATQAFIQSIFGPSLPTGQSPDGAHVAVLLQNSAIQFHSTGKKVVDARGRGRGLRICICVSDLEDVRRALGVQGIKCQDGAAAGHDGVEWLEFCDRDGYSWGVSGFPTTVSAVSDLAG